MTAYLIVSPSLHFPLSFFAALFTRRSKNCRYGLYVDYSAYWTYVDIVNARRYVSEEICNLLALARFTIYWRLRLQYMYPGIPYPHLATNSTQAAFDLGR